MTEQNGTQQSTDEGTGSRWLDGRRAFLTLLAVGSGGCLRSLQSSTDGESTTQSSERPPQSGSPTGTQPTGGTDPGDRTAAEPTGIETEWSVDANIRSTRSGSMETFAHVSTADDIVAVTRDGVIGLSAADGSQRWRRFQNRSIQPRIQALPGSNSGVAIADQSGSVYAVSASDGRTQWQTDLGIGSHFTAVRGGEELIVAGTTTRAGEFADPFVIAGLDVQSGTPNWRVTDDAFADSSGLSFEGGLSEPANGRILVSLANSVVAISVTEGRLLGDLDEIAQGDPSMYNAGFEPNVAAAQDGSIYVPNYRPYAVDVTAEYALSWTADPFESATTSTAVRGDDVAFGARDNGVYLLDRTDGTRRWRTNTDGNVVTTPIIDGTTVWAGTRSGTVYLLRRADGTLVGERSVDRDIHSTTKSGDGVIVSGGEGIHRVAPITA